VRAVALHADVLVATSAVLQANCVIVRGGAPAPAPGENPVRVIEPGSAAGQESFVVDSPVLPDELAALPALAAQARFPEPSGLLATHGDWDHLLGPLAFPGLQIGCAQSTAERLARSPGEAQRELRSFDEGLMVDRPGPLALGAVQGLPVPGRLEVGSREIELHDASGHTADGMALLLPWASVLICGDYLSAAEIPTLGAGGDAALYGATLERLRPLVGRCEHVVPGHGPVLARERALEILGEDLAYLDALPLHGDRAELPPSRRGAAQRRLHAANVALL